MRNHTKLFRTIGKRVFRSSGYCVLLLGAVVCSTCACAVPPDEIDWGWRIKPTFPNEASGPKTDVNPDLATVISAQNRAGRELPNVVTLYPGKLSIGDGVHYSSDGDVSLGRVAASGVEEFYRTNASRAMGSSIRGENK